MEYIREVLMRQRAAWQRLVLGGGRMETVPEGAAETRRRTDREIPEGAADRFPLSEGVTAEPDAAGTVPAESGWGEPGWSAGIGTEMGRGTQSWRTLERELAPRFYGLTLLDRTRLPRDLWQRRGEQSLTGLFLEEMWQLCRQSPEDPVCQLAARFGLAALENGEDAAL